MKLVVSGALQHGEALLEGALTKLRSVDSARDIFRVLSDDRLTMRVHSDGEFDELLKTMFVPQAIDVLAMVTPDAPGRATVSMHLSSRALVDAALGAVMIGHEAVHVDQLLRGPSVAERLTVPLRGASAAVTQAYAGWRTGSGAVPAAIVGALTSGVVEREIPAYLQGARIAEQLGRPELGSFAINPVTHQPLGVSEVRAWLRDVYSGVSR